MDGPVSPYSSTLVREGRLLLLLADDGAVRCDPVALAEVSFEPFKEIGPAAGTDDEHVPAVVLVSLAAQIAERSKGIQGARDNGLGDSEYLGQSADRVRTRRQVDHHQ